MKSGIIPPAIALMIVACCLATALAQEAGSNLGNVKGGDFHAARSIISKKCTVCHTDKVIDAALSANKDMAKIQQEMEKRGASLNSSEREVLGIYWKQNPLKQKQ